MTGLDSIKKIKINPRSKIFNLFAGNYKSAFKGVGLEFENIRPYVPGDNVRYIDWNSTAKSGTIYTKEFTETRELNVHFAIDNSSSMSLNEWNNKLSKKELIINTVYLIGLAANYNSDKISASIFSNRLNAITESKSSKSQLISIIKTIDKHSNIDFYQKLDLESYLKFLSEKLKHRSICIIFTDNIDITDNKTTKALKALNLRHEVIIIDIIEYIPNNIDLNDGVYLEDIETGEMEKLSKSSLTRYNQLIEDYKSKTRRELGKNNVDYLPISCDSDILKELIKFFKYRSAKYGYHS